MFLFGVRLVQVQALQANDYRSRAVNEMEKVKTLQAPRGDITDINGLPFARSVAATSIVVDQTQILNPAKTAAFVAPILGMSTAEVQTAITGKRKWYMVAENAKPATWLKLTKAIDQYNATLPGMSPERIIGFFPERSYVREYPSGSLIASLIGFVNHDGIGATGLESSMNSTISGINGKYSYANGYKAEIPGSQSEIIPAQAGTSIRLTVDRDIQWVASKAIADAVKSSNAISGTVIVMDPKTGQILAHATAPTFDPNNTKNVTLDLMRNPSVQEVYEPGSTGKVMTLAAALEEKKITPTTVFTVPYALKRSDAVFRDHEPHPVQRLTSTGILAVSSNTGSIKIGEMLSNDTLHSYLSKFGIGKSTGSGLPGESAGIFHPVKSWSGTSAPTIAFGHGYSVTAMQATSVFATIANDGVRMLPRLIAGYSNTEGVYEPTMIDEGVRVVSPETAKTVREMLEGVVSEDGTAKNMQIPGYRVGGKTGTANRYDEATGGYSGYTSSFIGMAPAEKPALVMSVSIHNPKTSTYGSVVAGPVFKKVMTYALAHKKVPPSTTKPPKLPVNW